MYSYIWDLLYKELNIKIFAQANFWGKIKAKRGENKE